MLHYDISSLKKSEAESERGKYETEQTIYQRGFSHRTVSGAGRLLEYVQARP
ncbi:hypothetical protein DDT54_09320 [Brenneria nigrifluens DSM 30175 = ATCC 13028]|uniref:Uncharacterized protein n=1 Tax=Brenneria nigrifluens DSM 30175 = ATCC 13028 TaxID=1121120 RepID=A0A2U1USC4_9GAMM|nr:hypothetical protein DDT54_09320 [Brenneria nigrifluens DSM 30175 = ATCC 13028]